MEVGGQFHPGENLTKGRNPQWRKIEPVWKVLDKRRFRALPRFELFKSVLLNKMKHLSLLYV